MKNKLNAEEQLLQEKLNQAEAGFSYQESSWQEMQQLLPKKGVLAKYGTTLKAGLGLIILAATAYVINGTWSNSPQNITENQNIIVNAKNTELTEESTTNSSTIINTDEKSERSEALTKSDENNVQIVESEESNSDNSANAQNTGQELITETNKPESTQKQAVEIESVKQKATNYKLGQIKIVGKPCIGSSISAEVNQKAEDQTIQLKWLIDGENQATNSTNANIQITKAGLLKIRVLALKDGVTIDSQETEFLIEENPEVNFTYHDLESPYNDLTVEFTAKPEGLADFSWEIEGSSNDLKGEKANYSFDRTGVFDVSLSHESKMGCISEITKPVAVEKNFDPLAPDVFTPDGNDLNEAFIPVGFTPEAGVITDDQFRMSIYDYNGRLVYTTRSNTEPWNGRLNNQGNVLAAGAYVWKVEIENQEGKQARFTGKIRIRY